MKRIALILCLAFAAPAFADDAGAPIVVEAISDAGVLTMPAEPVLAPAPASLDNPVAFVKVIFNHVKAGDWLGAAAALLVVIVSLLRVYGRKLHDWLPDNQIWDKPLWFLFDTKPGGWLLNLLTAVAGGIGTAQVAGEPVTWALLKPILLVSVSGAALWELVKDLMDFFKKKPAPAPAPVEPPKA